MPFDNLPYAEKISQHGFVPANHAEPQFFDVGIERIFANENNERYWQRVYNKDTDETIEIHSSRYGLTDYRVSTAALLDSLNSNEIDTTDMHLSFDMTENGGRLFVQALLPAYTTLEGTRAEALRIIMFDSYDGSCSFSIRAGRYKFVCANQAVIPYSGGEYGHIKARHTTNIMERTPEIIDTLLGAIHDFKTVQSRRALWDEVRLEADQAYELLSSMKVSKSVRDHIYQEFVQDLSWSMAGLDDCLTTWATHYKDPNVKTQIERQHVVAALEGSKPWFNYEPELANAA
jgi:hypothetical protein